MDKENSLLEQLAEMGFTDKQHNTSLLRQMRYDMDHAFSEHALRRYALSCNDKQHNTSLLRQMRYDMDHAFSEHALR